MIARTGVRSLFPPPRPVFFVASKTTPFSLVLYFPILSALPPGAVVTDIVLSLREGPLKVSIPCGNDQDSFPPMPRTSHGISGVCLGNIQKRCEVS